jgi:hypothetical protein
VVLLLAGLEGTVLCDAESRLDAMFEDGRVEANCNAHPRRKFRDAREGQAFLDAVHRVEKEARQRAQEASRALTAGRPSWAWSTPRSGSASTSRST